MRGAVMLSIRPEWVEKILSGEKTLEIRKSKPRLVFPFKCYIYKTNCGGVVGEFVCDRIDRYVRVGFDGVDSVAKYMRCDENLYAHPLPLEEMCMTYDLLKEYAGGNELFGFHISKLKVYKESKPISAFLVEDNRTYDCPQLTPMKRPPQSWCYVEGMT